LEVWLAAEAVVVVAGADAGVAGEVEAEGAATAVVDVAA
jgi:hypothetical protein